MPDLESRVEALEERVSRLEHPETVPDDTAPPGAPAVPEAPPGTPAVPETPPEAPAAPQTPESPEQPGY